MCNKKYFLKQNTMTDQELRDLNASTMQILHEVGIKLNDFGTKLNDFGIKLNDFGIKLNDFGIKLNDFGIKMEELRASQAKTDKQMDRTDKKIQRLEQTLEKTIKKLDGMWVTQWEISEDLFWENFEEMFLKEWKNIFKVQRNLIIKWKCEYDLIWINGSEVFVWEIKTRLTISHIDEFITKRLQTFRGYVPEYNNYKLFWFVWGRVLAKWALEYARNKGLYVMKQDSKWHAKMISNQGKEFFSENK